LNSVIIGARLALIGIFAVAAIAKLADMPGSRTALGDFAVPTRFVGVLAIALPLVELATATLLVIAPTAQVGAGLALVVLLVFVVAIGSALRRGAAPQCHCFGQLHSRPAGAETLVRNVVLSAIAALILIGGPGPRIDSWFSDNSGDVIALLITSLATTVLIYACLSLWQQNRLMAGRGLAADLPSSPNVGDRIPMVRVTTLDGDKVTVSELLEGTDRAILVFTSATCGPCVGLLEELSRWRQMLRGRLSIHVLAAGDVDVNRELSAQHAIPMLLDETGAAARGFGVGATPGAIEVHRSGTIESAPVAGGPAIEGLIRSTLKRPKYAGLDVRRAAELSGRLVGVTELPPAP
jgi:uncharacterized membrane protein YphA (DoxX/SURF4 family)